MIKYNNRYWIESLPNITTFEKPKSPFHRTEPPAYTRIEIFEEQTYLCDTPTPYHVTQYEDVFITYTGGFDIPYWKNSPFTKEGIKKFSLQLA